MTERAGRERMRNRHNHSEFVRSMLLTWSAVQAMFGAVLLHLGVRADVWYVAVLGVASCVIGGAIFVDEATNA